MTTYYDPTPLLNMANSFNWNNRQIAEGADVNIKSVHRWKRENTKINYIAADKLCISLGLNLEMVYPYDN